MKTHDLKIRVGNEIKAWLAARAAENCRTMNGEITAILKAARENEAKEAA